MRLVRYLLSLILICLPLLGGTLSAGSEVANATSSYRLSGVVRDQRTRAPVPRCHLSAQIEAHGEDRSQWTLTGDPVTGISDADGHFALDLPSAGRWHLTASAPGFRSQFYNEHENFSSAVVIFSNAPPPALVFDLEPDGVIAGLVLDEAAEPVRNATISLEPAKSASPDGVSPFGPQRQTVTTDDRGRYELAGIPTGRYNVSVQATPWYAAGGRGPFQNSGKDPDASLDVIYPLTWYPGVQDAAAAGEVDVHGGETRQINFDLLPMPAAHLRVTLSASTSAAAELGRRLPQLERVDGAQTASRLSFAQPEAGGQLDFGSLAPGLYRYSTPGAEGAQSTTYLQIQGGTTTSLSAANGLPTADVSFQLQGEGSDSRAQVVLTNIDTRVVFQNGNGGSGGGLRRRRSPGLQARGTEVPERTLQVPAGRYSVTLAGARDLYVLSLSLKGKLLSGRVVSLAAGPVALTVNVGRGPAEVTGHVLENGKACEGAMVMLVPVSLGQTGSIELLRRDQSNTDGSFELFGVIPGQYILLAIDHGWAVNWHDPATLSRYLVRGIPVTVQPHNSLQQEVAATPR